MARFLLYPGQFRDNHKEETPMEKRPLFLVLLLGLASLMPAYSQQPDIWPWPYPVADESGFHFLPVGGWNSPGSLSPNSLALGESYLIARNSTAGFLNPASLSFLSAPQFSLSYRYTENRYKTSSSPLLEIPVFGDSFETRSFRRKTDVLDSAGLVLPFENWVLAANYFIFQENNFPDIKGPYWGYPVPMVQPEIWLGYQSVSQTGRLKGVNLAFSYRLTESFSLGASVSYVFGDIDRVEESPEVYILEPEPRDGTLPFSPEFPSAVQKYSYDARGFFTNLGFTWELSRQLVLGFSLRPPFSLDIQTDREFTDSSGLSSSYSQDNYFRHPLVAVASMLFRPLKAFELTADLSYWGWGETSTDIDPGWFGSYDFRSVVKLNLGAEYKIGLPFETLPILALRAGYIYDPQPYRFIPRVTRDYVTFGFGLPAGRLDLHVAAKLGLSARELNRFHTDVLQVGAGYRF